MAVSRSFFFTTVRSLRETLSAPVRLRERSLDFPYRTDGADGETSPATGAARPVDHVDLGALGNDLDGTLVPAEAAADAFGRYFVYHFPPRGIGSR
jgi:hypothetical protein